MSVVKSTGSKIVDVKLVAKAVKLTNIAGKSWAEAKKEVVSLLAQMNNAERSDWLEQVIVSNNTFKGLFRRMASSASRGLVEAEHLYGDSGIVSHIDIDIASDKALKLIANPNSTIDIVDKYGDLHTALVSKMTSPDMRRAWDHNRGQISVKEQLEALNKTKQLEAPTIDAIATVLSATMLDGALIIKTDGKSNSVKLTSTDVKRFLDMLIK